MQKKIFRTLSMFQSTLPTRGSDKNLGTNLVKAKCFNPRSPRGGATQRSIAYSAYAIGFNPRSPRGGATAPLDTPKVIRTGFNPRSPRGGATRILSHSGFSPRKFQSTLPTRGSDSMRFVNKVVAKMFQSTLPTRGSDDCGLGKTLMQLVSIHAPHEGERRPSIYFIISG